MGKLNSKSETVWDEALRIMNEAGQQGIRVDMDGLWDWVGWQEKSLVFLQGEIEQITGIKKPGSSKQVATWLNLLGVSLRGSSKERLQLVQDKGNVREIMAANLIGKYRTLRKNVSMAIKLLENCKDGRYHYVWKASVKSGRLYSGIQNMSADIRDFLLPEEGHVVLVLDYESQELRILLHETGEKDLLALLDSGEDFHKKMAAAVYGISEDEVTETQRNRGKAVTYGIPYGQQVRGLVFRHYGLTEAAAENLMENYFKLRPKLREWMTCQEQEWWSNGFTVTTKLGRVRENCPKESIIVTKIQGSGADVLCSAICREAVFLKLVGARILVSVHDSLILSIPKEMLNHRIKMQIHDEFVLEDCPGRVEPIQSLMENTPEYGKMPVKAKSGLTWGEAHRG